MTVENCLLSILIALLLPSFGIALSAMAGGQDRVSRRPPAHPPGWNNIKPPKRAREQKDHE